MRRCSDDGELTPVAEVPSKPPECLKAYAVDLSGAGIRGVHADDGGRRTCRSGARNPVRSSPRGGRTDFIRSPCHEGLTPCVQACCASRRSRGGFGCWTFQRLAERNSGGLQDGIFARLAGPQPF